MRTPTETKDAFLAAETNPPGDLISLIGDRLIHVTRDTDEYNVLDKALHVLEMEDCKKLMDTSRSMPVKIVAIGPGQSHMVNQAVTEKFNHDRYGQTLKPSILAETALQDNCTLTIDASATSPSSTRTRLQRKTRQCQQR